MHEKIFEAAPFFLLRIPTWPSDKFGCSLFNKKCKSPLEIYSENEELREAIAIASPSLYDSLKKRNPKNSIQEAKSLSHYISRMMIRPTPFGLFSAVSTAKWGDITHIEFKEHLLRKRTRLDMEWVYLLIQKLYEDEEKFLFLPVRTNPLLQLSGERYHLDYLRYIGDAGKESSSSSTSKSVRATQLIYLILDYAKECISVDQLWLRLQESLPFLAQDKTMAVIRQLFSQQFLLSGHIPSLLSSSSFESLRQHLSLFPCLEAIFDEIKNYDELPAGRGEKSLEKLQCSMSAFAENKSYLQVDTAYEGKNLELSKIVLEELEKAINFLWKIANLQNTPNNLTDYHSKFIKKYDIYRTVPLLDLLDSEKGMGPIFENITSLSSDNEWEKWVKQQWQDCLFHKKKEWVLTEESVNPFLLLSKQNSDPVDAPLSLDVLCKVFADSYQNIDSGNFLLALGYIAKEGGSTFGRFLDLLGNETQEKVAQLFALEECLETQSVFVELSYLPSAVRHANLAIHPCMRNYRLDIEETDLSQNGTLSLEDIYVGATTSKFYLTDKESQVNIITRANHVFNVFYDPLPFKFMRNVTQSQYTSLPLSLWGSLQETAIFLPRVRYCKTILSPATWNIDSQPYIQGSVEKNISTFNAWAEQWDLPRSFFMVHGDQHLLFDRSNPDHIDEIVGKLKKGKSLKFIEKIEGAWIKGTDGNHACEISVPFVKNIKYARKENQIKAFPYTEEMERCHFPGSNWLFLKLYMGGDKINEFLIGYLYNFMEGLCQEGKIKEWFIVRYYDPDPHLRLRIYSESIELISKVLIAIEEQLRLWTHLGWLKDVTIAKYEREIERYGGSFLIESAENVFYCDTLATLFILQAFLTRQMQCDEVVLYTLSVINFLRSFNLDINQMFLLLNKLALDESELKGFRQCKNQLITLISAMQQESINEIPEIQVMNVALQIRKEGVQNFCKLAIPLEKERFDSIILSILHMHCNRLGCLGKEETKAKLYARQALLSILSKESAGLDFLINQAALK